MSDSPKDQGDDLPEPEADARFNRIVGNLVNTPHRPHVAKKPVKGAKRAAPKADQTAS